jgi:hypothetical protein
MNVGLSRPCRCWWLGLPSFCVLLGIAGCTVESDRREISGTVSIDGTAVARGSISFFPDRGQSGPAASTSISNGKYRFTTDNGPVSGSHRVIVGIETDRRWMTDAAPSLSANSALAKPGPSQIATDRQRSEEPIEPSASRTQWEATADVPAANSSSVDETINFVLQSEVDPDSEISKEPQ